MNSSVLTASLTGRIQFFYNVALLRTITYDNSICFHSPLGPTATPRLCRTFVRSSFEE